MTAYALIGAILGLRDTFTHDIVIRMLCLAFTVLALQVGGVEDPAPKPEEPERHLLWPAGAPRALGDEPKDRPQITVYPANGDGAANPAILICPGGGYGTLAMDHEGHQIARWLAQLGVTGVILEYRHRGGGYGHPVPLEDAQRAMRLVRTRATEWRLDPAKLGVLGFSAGGHLASSLSVHHDAGDPNASDAIDRTSCRPDFAVLCYPVIAFDQPFTHRGSQRNLLGDDAAPELIDRMSSERQVTTETPPTFLWHTTADRGVSPKNSLVYYQALLEHDVPCELHVFEAGRHGIGLGKGLPAEAWPELCRSWLIGRGVLAR
ncbi:MAG: alpha/beta hydrolase [Planctomycetota bacterium]